MDEYFIKETVEYILLGTEKLIYWFRYLNKMRLLSQKSREYEGKEYKKFWIIVPNKLIDRLGWKAGEELEAEVKEDKLVVKKD